MKLLVLGLGNDLLGDDGIGLEAAALLECELEGVADVKTTARAGLYLLEQIEGYDDALIIDSVLGDAPGRVRELTPMEVKPVVVPSAHYVGLPEALALARSSGVQVPSRMRIFAVEMPATQVIGSKPSPAVRAALPELVRRVKRAAAAWGYGD